MRLGREPWYLVAGGFVIAWVALDLLTGLLHPSPGLSPWYPGAGLTVTLLYRFGLRYAPAIVVAFGVLTLDPGRLVGFSITFIPVAVLATREGMRGAVLGAAALDLTLVATDAVTHPGAAAVVSGQLEAIVQTVLALVVGSLASARMRYQYFSRWILLHDLRTSLPNRVAFDAWVEDARAGELWIACLDLDHFGSVDAAMERDAADTLLREATERIASAVPAPEFFGRFESEAFVVARAGTRDDAVTYANRVIDAFRAPLPTGDAALRFTVSIGVASGLGRDRRALLTEAIAAMREAKSAGGNQLVVFEPPPGLARGARLASELVRARDHGEFLLYFQPIHRLGDGVIVGFEALLRWRHPELGLLRPASFLPALERSAMLDEIESWVVHAAAGTLARLRDDRGLRVWINLSGRAAFDDAFIDEIPAIARAAGTRAERLAVEVTEQVVAGSNRMAEITQRLHALGIGVAVDDFGTGHSTLDRVRASHVDYVKLDRSFVAAVADDERARGVALAMLAVAERIDALAVAEGLETAAQIAIFRDAGCRLGQGYALSEPMDERALRIALA